MRPIDFCTPKPFQLEHSYVVASQRDDFLATPCGAVREPPSYRSLAAPCSFARTSLSRAGPHVRRRVIHHREARGRPMRTRPGRIALHGALPTSATGRCSRGGVFFRRVTSNNRPPLAPLSPPPIAAARARFSSSVRQWLGGRQDRFRGGLVKGVRFSDPGCLPPTDADAHLARAEARTKPRSLHRRRGAHVMRIAELTMIRPPFAAGASLRLRAWATSDGQAPVHALLCGDEAFDPAVTGGALL